MNYQYKLCSISTLNNWIVRKSNNLFEIYNWNKKLWSKSEFAKSVFDGDWTSKFITLDQALDYINNYDKTYDEVWTNYSKQEYLIRHFIKNIGFYSEIELNHFIIEDLMNAFNCEIDRSNNEFYINENSKYGERVIKTVIIDNIYKNSNINLKNVNYYLDDTYLDNIAKEFELINYTYSKNNYYIEDNNSFIQPEPNILLKSVIGVMYRIESTVITNNSNFTYNWIIKNII